MEFPLKLFINYVEVKCDKSYYYDLFNYRKRYICIYLSIIYIDISIYIERFLYYRHLYRLVEVI